MKKRMKKLLKKTGKTLLIVICALMLYAVICTMFVDHMTYFPLSGRIFNIDPDEIEMIAVQYSGPNGRTEIKDGEGKANIAAYLNALRYRYWYPLPDVGFGGYTYGLVIDEGEDHYFYRIVSDGIYANGIVYVMTEAEMEYLRSLVPGYPR